ncbi:MULTISPECIES: glutathione S-transferase family protein [Nitrincola]|uniref:GST-like protein yfcG n=1 Tax=Nitrincola nitratireducens TaxID=1229521 RepID=W9UZR7_9GAMM|nr:MULTISPECIES: glutathione S-transferase N-terminal domain-containing protein [Nitrincola]EXJ10211.1 GST-like protein yfcG [Nitrincola nitratireducens]
MIDLYTWGTPNGCKVSIMLEACRLHYSVHPINILKNEQFSEHFLKISPNNKIPAIVDPDGPDGQPITLFESGAILQYLADKTGEFLPSSGAERYEVLQWLNWQMGGFGPFLGQAHHFNRFAPEPVPYAIDRYNAEAARLWKVLNTQLSGKAFVVNDLTIADFAIYPWACRYEWQNITLSDYPNVQAWMERMASLAFVERGMQIP